MLIADDSAKMRSFIRSMVADLAGEVFECADGAQAVALYSEHRPDWVLMDIEMPVLDGIAATRRICEISPQAKVIIVTVFSDPALRRAALEAGAVGYVLKENLIDLRRLLAAA
jgi:CheY-like chemotaxis protein